MWTPLNQTRVTDSNLYRSARLDSNFAFQHGSFKSSFAMPEPSNFKMTEWSRGNSGEPGSATPPATILHRLCALLWNRSRRRETDKLSSIQRHLRAVRQAEDLDRQTHFRRSQVQRLVQRFDQPIQTGSGRLVAMHSVKDELCEQEQQRALATIMNQLIGPANVRKLATALTRYASQPSGGDRRKSSQLDLSLGPDRELAVALLNCLGRMAQRSIECLETSGQLASDSMESIEMLICSPESQKSNFGHQRASWPEPNHEANKWIAGPASKMQPATSKDGRSPVEDMNDDRQTCRQSTLSQGEPVSQKSLEQTFALAIGSSSTTPSNIAKAFARDNSSASGVLPPSLALAGQRDCQDKLADRHQPAKVAKQDGDEKDHDDDYDKREGRPEQEDDDDDDNDEGEEEDPIKRALDTIMGWPSTALSRNPFNEASRSRKLPVAGRCECASDNHKSLSRRQNQHLCRWPPGQLGLEPATANQSPSACLFGDFSCCCCCCKPVCGSNKRRAKVCQLVAQVGSHSNWQAASLSEHHRSRLQSRSPASRRRQLVNPLPQPPPSNLHHQAHIEREQEEDQRETSRQKTSARLVHKANNQRADL